MVDRRRPYRAWMIRHAAGPALTAAVALGVAAGLTRAFAGELWLLIPSLFLVGLLSGAVLGFVGLELVRCRRSHALGRHREAQIFRHQLRALQPLVEASLVLFAFLAVAPAVLLEPAGPRTPPAGPAERRSAPAAVRPELRAESAPAPLPLATATGGTSGSAPDPQAPGGTPPGDSVGTGSEAPPTSDAANPYLTLPASARLVRGERMDFFRTEFSAFRFPDRSPDPVTLDRLGLPDESPAGAAPPVELRFEALMLDPGDDGELTASRFWLDTPVGPGDSIRVSGMAALRGSGEEATEHRAEDLAWQHASITWTRRLVGYTRHAPFDLAFSAGVSNDRFFSAFGSSAILTVDDLERVSPYLALDIAFWQARSCGFLFHLGQTVPANLTGGAIALTEASATVRYDASETFSFHAGLQAVRFDVVDYPDPLTFRHGRTAEEDLLVGPVVGIDIRF